MPDTTAPDLAHISASPTFHPAASLINYRLRLKVPLPFSGLTTFGAIADDWQLDLIAQLASAADWIAGRSAARPAHQYFWNVLPKGHDKTSLLASVCNWLAQYSRRPIRGVVAAGDFKQAQLVRNAMLAEKRDNPDLLPSVSIGQNKIEGPGGTFGILTSDAPSEHGELVDVTIADEVTHWSKSADGFWNTLIENAYKRSQVVDGKPRFAGLFVASSNAGYEETWQWYRYKHACSSPEWSVYCPDGRLASWLGGEFASDLPSHEVERQIFNRWQGGTENPLILSDWLSRAEAAMLMPLQPLAAGIDIAWAGGDDNVIVITGKDAMLAGWEIDIGQGRENADTLALADEIERLVKGEWMWRWPGPDAVIPTELRRHPGEHHIKVPGWPINPAMIAMDATEGAGVMLVKILQQRGINIIPEDFGGRPHEDRKGQKLAKASYLNRRAQMYGEAANLLNPSLVGSYSIPPGYHRLRRELAAQPRMINTSGKLRLPPKELIVAGTEEWARERLVQSPDWCLVAGTMVETSEGNVPIEDIRSGVLVLTRMGYRKVTWSGMTNEDAATATVIFSDGNEIRGTWNHPVFVDGKGWVRIDSLVLADRIITCNQLSSMMPLSSSMGSRSSDGPGLGLDHPAYTTTQIQRRFARKLEHSIRPYGYSILGQSPRGRSCITRTEILSTTPCQTLSALLEKSTESDTNLRSGNLRHRLISSTYPTFQQNGTEAPRDESGIQSTERRRGRIEGLRSGNVVNAERGTKKGGSEILGFGSVLVPATIDTGTATRSGGSKSSALCASPPTFLHHETENQPAHVCVLHVSESPNAPVYNLAVEEAEEYFANGVLVHNSDAFVLARGRFGGAMGIVRAAPKKAKLDLKWTVRRNKWT